MTSKERAKLKALASAQPTILQIGKGGISQQLIKQVDDALEARELIKLCVLETAPLEAEEAAQTLAEATGSQVVQTIGRRLVLFRRNSKKPMIEL